MVIKPPLDLRGESAGGDRSASSISKCSAGINSDLGNGSFWIAIEIHDAKYVDQCKCMDLHAQRRFGLIAPTDL